MGVAVVLVGLFALGLSCWLAYGEWIRVAKWPRTNATLVSKDISTVGARLVFYYEVGGRRISGLGFRWGSEKTVRTVLESYQPGTIQRVGYNPDDPSEVETILSYSWELFRPSSFGAGLGVFLIFGGIVVYRWSLWGSQASSN
jgi:hypothetical protein